MRRTIRHNKHSLLYEIIGSYVQKYRLEAVPVTFRTTQFRCRLNHNTAPVVSVYPSLSTSSAGSRPVFLCLIQQPPPPRSTTIRMDCRPTTSAVRQRQVPKEWLPECRIRVVAPDHLHKRVPTRRAAPPASALRCALTSPAD